MSALFNNSHYTKKFQETVDYLKKKKKVLFITTSNRYKEEKEKPKSTVLAYLLSKEIGEDKVTIIDASSLKIYNCEGNVSRVDGNQCGLKAALLKNKEKNPSGYHRCWASYNNQDDELWKISKELFESDAVIFFGSIRWGQMNAYYQKLIERLNWIENRHTTLKEENVIKDIEAGIIITGQNWNGEEVMKTQKQVFKFYGFKVPNQLSWFWQFTTDELDETKESYIKSPKKFEEIFKVKILSLTKPIEKLRNLIKEHILKLVNKEL
jgi:multimeric flavodoxin WrbA